MKVLFTGMASSHSKPSANVTFFNNLAKHVGTQADVEWNAPSVTWTKDYLEQYDAIFVGILPPTSPSANKMYGAMHVIDLMFESPKLNLVLDHPQLWQYKHGFNAIDRSIDSVFGSFYSKRSEFTLTRDSHTESVISANRKLLTKKWPTTLYPSLPWKSNRPVDKLLGLFAEDSLVGLSFDAWLFDDTESVSEVRGDHWVADSPGSEWTKSISKLLEMPIASVKQKPRMSDADSLQPIQEAAGFLLSPQERGVGIWWSYRIIQALQSKTFILSNWRETGILGPEWNLLGSDWESLTKSDKIAIAEAQKESYLNAIPSKLETASTLSSILETSRKGEKNARR
jgi:hypothetical protein